MMIMVGTVSAIGEQGGNFDLRLEDGKTVWVDPTPDPDFEIAVGDRLEVEGGWALNFGTPRDLFHARRTRKMR